MLHKRLKLDDRSRMSVAAYPAMDPWERFHNEFKALMEEEDRIVQQRGLRDWFHGDVIYGASGEFGSWSFASSPTESIQARFELLATEAGIALSSPPGTLPHVYWLHRLFVDLRANKSRHMRIYDIDNDAGGVIERLFEASATYCIRLKRQSLENIAGSYEGPGFERRPANQLAEVNTGQASDTGKESVHERSERRSAVVTPILASKKWARCRWAAKAGVGKNSVYEYLNGKRNLSIANRQALAEELGLEPQDLPD